jgi:LemA protein
MNELIGGIMLGVIIFVSFILLSVVIAVGIYNSMVTLRNRYKNAFSQIDVQLKRRYDLIPNLVETAKAYLTHERQTLEAVIQGRNQAFSANQKAAGNPADGTAMNELIKAEGVLGQSLSRLMAVVENYPDLKGDKTMNQLMEELSSTENRIGFARQAYNDSATDYNNAIETFPNSVLAGTFQFKEAVLFHIENMEERKAPQVKFA